MNKNIERIINIAANIVGTAWDLADQVREYIPSILYLLSNLASVFATLLSCTLIILQDIYSTLLPLCVASTRAGARALREGGTLLMASAPMLLNRLYACLRAFPEKGMLVSKLMSKSKSKLGASWKAAWQFRKECLA